MDDKGYNTGNDNANDQWKSADNEHQDRVVERIHTNELTHVTKPDCQHLNTVEEPADDFDDGVINVSCLDCPLGWPVRAPSKEVK